MTSDAQIEARLALGARQYQLSRRQTELFVHIVRGRTSRTELAEAMGLRPDTIKHTIQAALRKLDAGNQTQAMARLLGLETHDVPT